MACCGPGPERTTAMGVPVTCTSACAATVESGAEDELAPGATSAARGDVESAGAAACAEPTLHKQPIHTRVRCQAIRASRVQRSMRFVVRTAGRATPDLLADRARRRTARRLES